MLECMGYEIVTAEDGVEALHKLAEAVPDVIISDLKMPRMSGFEFLAMVRAHFPHVPVIATSGEYAGSEVPSGVLADAFLPKGSYTVDQLSATISQLISVFPIRPVAGPASADHQSN